VYSLFAQAQDSATLSVNGYIETYFQYDLNKPVSKERPFFLYNHKRHNEFNINIAFIKVAYAAKKTTANLALMAGTYAQYNLANEPKGLQYIYEANVGYSFSEKWSLDAGILPSHIGMESAVSKDCWNVSRSLLAENSPYYEAGLKLNYKPNPKWSTSLLLLNGWQNIQETNAGKAIGLQVQFKPNGKWLLNSSTFWGNEKPDSVLKQRRFFHNFYATYTALPKLNMALLFDVGTENNNTWYGAAFLLQYATTKKTRLAFRAEKYQDNAGVIIPVTAAGGFNVKGLSINADILPASNLALRVEARYLQATNNLFIKDGVPRSNSFSFLSSMAVSF
jgi:hypothetical protein